jgi:hypothetical protein
MVQETQGQKAIWIVEQTLEFANGDLHSIPVATKYSESEAKATIREREGRFSQVFKVQGVAPALASLGIVRFGHRLLQLTAPDSVLVRPPAGLVVPRA